MIRVLNNLVAEYLVLKPTKPLPWVRLLELDFQFPYKISNVLSANPNAIYFLENNPDYINWWFLSANPNAINILENNIDKVNWDYLSINTHSRAIHILEKNIDKVDWSNLSSNPSAIDILEQHIDKVEWI